jgi:hypothetical protein
MTDIEKRHDDELKELLAEQEAEKKALGEELARQEAISKKQEAISKKESFTETEVRELLRDIENGEFEKVDEDGEEGLYCLQHGRDNLKLKNGLTLEFVKSHGGYEGGGEEHWIVFKLKNQYWEIPGWYQSYHGAEIEINKTFEVKPEQKTITVYTEV